MGRGEGDEGAVGSNELATLVVAAAVVMVMVEEVALGVEIATLEAVRMAEPDVGLGDRSGEGEKGPSVNLHACHCPDPVPCVSTVILKSTELSKLDGPAYKNLAVHRY